MAVVLVDHCSPNIVEPQSIYMNENNSQCDDVGCKEAIEFIHNLLDRAMRSKHFNTVQYFRDFLKINIYIWISKTFTFASIKFPTKTAACR